MGKTHNVANLFSDEEIRQIIDFVRNNRKWPWVKLSLELNAMFPDRAVPSKGGWTTRYRNLCALKGYIDKKPKQLPKLPRVKSMVPINSFQLELMEAKIVASVTAFDDIARLIRDADYGAARVRCEEASRLLQSVALIDLLRTFISKE